MDLSVDEKIQAAIDPLLQRINALETDNQRFKEEIAALHALTQPKPNHKPRMLSNTQHKNQPSIMLRDLKLPKDPGKNQNITK